MYSVFIQSVLLFKGWQAITSLFGIKVYTTLNMENMEAEDSFSDKYVKTIKLYKHFDAPVTSASQTIHKRTTENLLWLQENSSWQIEVTDDLNVPKGSLKGQEQLPKRFIMLNQKF